MAEKTREAGFTFLEIILVLSVLSILTAIIIPLGDRWIRETSDEEGLRLLIAEIQSLQSYSLANGVYTKLRFRDLGREYVSSTTNGIELNRKRFPEGMTKLDSSNLKSVDFQPNGSLVELGTLAIRTNSGIILIKFQFQQGRMIIVDG